MENESHKVLDNIKNDGTVFDTENKLIGTIKSDGTVQNQKVEIIGYGKNVPIKWSAVYFFFLF
ncbi:MAG: 5-fold beta-flower protein [Bacteroidota bacterium]